MHKLKRVVVACGVLVTGAAAADDVQRQLQQRELQQLELRLKMQQQLDRAAQPHQTPGAELRQRQVERDQQQRLQQLQDQEARRAIAPAPAGAGDGQGAIEQRRAAQAGAEHLNRFGAERRPGTEPSR
jgi:hypothetical protein